MVTVLPKDERWSNLGKYLGVGLEQAAGAFTDKWKKEGEQKKSAEGIVKLMGSLGIEVPEGLSDELSGMSVDQQMMGFKAMADLKGKEKGLMGLQEAQELSRASGGVQSPEAFLGKTHEQVRDVLRAQEVGGVTGSQREKAFLDTNIKREEATINELDLTKKSLNVSNTLMDLVQSGETQDKMSNLVEEYDIKALKPFFVTPGTKAYKAGFKNLFSDFKTIFGSRPIGYEAQIFESGLPDLLSPDDAKMASLYMYNAPREETLIRNNAHLQAIQELGYTASPNEIRRRQEEIVADGVDKLWQDTRNKVFGMIYKKVQVPEGYGVYWDSKAKKAITGGLSDRDEAEEKGIFLIGG